MKLIGIMNSLFFPLWHQYDKTLPMERKILDSSKNSFSVSFVEFRGPSRWYFPFMRQMIWIIGPAACKVSTLGHSWTFYTISGPVTVVVFEPSLVAPAFQRGLLESPLEPPGLVQSKVPASSTWNSLMMTHNEENLPTGAFSPSQREQQVSICRITSFRSAAFGH